MPLRMIRRISGLVSTTPRKQVFFRPYATTPTPRLITVPYEALLDDNPDNSTLGDLIEEAYGEQGLGILTVSGVPGLAPIRERLLTLGANLATAPPALLAAYEDPVSRYGIGWSRGKEALEDGKPDDLKGSYYANPLLDTPTSSHDLLLRYPAMCGPNIWPSDSFPDFESAFKTAGALVAETGQVLARQCDRYVRRKRPLASSQGGIGPILARSRCHKARLLYYFPQPGDNNSGEDSGTSNSWCAWHTVSARARAGGRK